MTPNTELVLLAMILVTAIHTTLNTLEHLSTRGRFEDGGLLNWDVSKLYVRTANPLSPLFEPVLRHPRFRVLLGVRLGCGLLLGLLGAHALLAGGSLVWTIAPPLLLFIFVATICNCIRHQAGLSGDDHMSLVVTGGLFVATLVPSGSVAQFIAILFIAIQVTLSYFIAGAHKLRSGSWRDGSALRGVMSTKAWGHPQLYRALNRYPKLNLSAAWAVIGFEVLFPVWLVTSPDGTLLFLAVAFFFHISNAVFMGLNGFLLMFPAAYPAVYYISHAISSTF